MLIRFFFLILGLQFTCFTNWLIFCCKCYWFFSLLFILQPSKYNDSLKSDAIDDFRKWRSWCLTIIKLISHRVAIKQNWSNPTWITHFLGTAKIHKHTPKQLSDKALAPCWPKHKHTSVLSTIFKQSLERYLTKMSKC